MFFSLSLSVGPSGSEQGIQLRHSSSLSSVAVTDADDGAGAGAVAT